MASALQGPSSQVAPTYNSRVRHNAQRLLAAFHAMRHMRYRMGNFEKVLKACVETQWPQLFPEGLLQPNVSASFLFRSQLIIDIALATALTSRNLEHRPRHIHSQQIQLFFTLELQSECTGLIAHSFRKIVLVVAEVFLVQRTLLARVANEYFLLVGLTPLIWLDTNFFSHGMCGCVGLILRS